MEDLSGITLVNIHHKVPYDVYIGRPGKGQPDNIWKNPYIAENRSIEEIQRVVKEHKTYLWNSLRSGKITVENLLSLKGKRLACFCASADPNVKKPCHGDNYVSSVNFLIREGISTQEDLYAWLASKDKT